MRELPFGGHEVDAFLDGKVAADDAPPGFQGVARLVGAARAPARADELTAQDHVVATLMAAVRGSAGVSDPTDEGRRPMLTRLLTAKMAAAAAVVAAVVGGGAAAAATGALPTSLQSSVSRGLAAVGISVPNPDAHATGHGGPTLSGSTDTQGSTGVAGTSPTQAVGPSATGSARYGLCTAYAAASGSDAVSHSVAFRNLSAAASAKGETVAAFCTGVTPSSTAPTTNGAPDSPATASATGQANGHEPATAGPPSGAATGGASGHASTNSHVPTTVGPPAGLPGASGAPGRPSTSSGHPG